MCRLQDAPEDITIAIAITLSRTRNRQEVKRWTLSLSLHVDKPFWPVFQSLTEHLDELVWSYLSLQIRGTDEKSKLVQGATMAGGYLCLFFPSTRAADDLRQFVNGYSNNDVDSRLKANFARFSVLRFAELIDETITAIRLTNAAVTTHNDSLNIVIAARVLYSELDYVTQGLLHGSLQLLCVGILHHCY
jgi:hypothetical protein